MVADADADAEAEGEVAADSEADAEALSEPEAEADASEVVLEPQAASKAMELTTQHTQRRAAGQVLGHSDTFQSVGDCNQFSRKPNRIQSRTKREKRLAHKSVMTN